MNLADYQSELVNKIYHLLVKEEQNRGITLYGDAGSGKSTIARGVAEQLREGWSIFYIEGIDPSLSPYLTWHIGTELNSRKKLNLGVKISFGINFFPSPFSLEFESTPQRDKQSSVLSPSEEALVLGIRQQAGGNHNILFIADNYESWDIPSKQLLQKIMLPQLELLPEFHLTALIVSREKTSIGNGFSWDHIPIPEILDDDILFIIRQQGCTSSINMDIGKIRLCAGNDLSLAIMAANYYDGKDISSLTFHEILDKRYKGLSPADRDACKVLEPLSIIDSCFTKDETAFFLGSSSEDRIETEYRAEESLTLAEEQRFIVGTESYHFTSDKIKAYFKMQLSRREKLYHRKFADYLQKFHPEDFFSRGKHLERSIQTNDPKLILDAWQLLFLSYIRRASETGETEDIYQIFPDIEALLERLPPSLAGAQRHVLEEFRTGYKEFSIYHYEKALYHLQAITASQLISACLAEIQRLILLCYIQLANNPILIQRCAEELYDTIHEDGFGEDELYCRAALVLLDAYIDRSNDAQKAKNLQRRFIRIIQKYPGRPIFEEFEACYNRKAALYYTAVIACRQTDKSIQFYRSRQNRISLYMALCNHSGNAIISGNYNVAEQSLTECINMLKCGKRVYYPSQYKIENNRILLTYLQDERNAGDDHDKLLSAAQKASVAFSKIAGHQDDEVSHVVLFNYLGLSILCNSPTWPEELASANLLMAEVDEYYQYFLHDLNFAAALLQEDLAAAQRELSQLKNMDVPLLYNYKEIFFKRQSEQESLLKTPLQFKGAPLTYHKRIAAACSHVQDPSCRFFGRGFLLSDLQFLSF